jgi:hypothetical protein
MINATNTVQIILRIYLSIWNLNNQTSNKLYFPFVLYTPAPNWHMKITQQIHCELQWATFLFKLVIVAVRQELFILLLQTGRSGSVSRICSLIEVPGCWLHTSQFEAIAEAERNQQIITVSQILRGIAKE